MKIKIIKSIKAFWIISLIVLLFASCISSYVGYNGYEKWKYRRSTFGNKEQYVNRKVFIKSLEYSSNIVLNSFEVYIEKGFRYGYNGNHETVVLENDKYPFQVCYNISIDKSNVYKYDNSSFKTKIDSLSSVYFLEKPYLDTPFVVKISKLVNNQWDSIGYIKVWDPKK